MSVQQQCLKNAFHKFSYIPNQNAQQPADYKQVAVTKSPEAKIFSGQIPRLERLRLGELIGIGLSMRGADVKGEPTWAR